MSLRVLQNFDRAHFTGYFKATATTSYQFFIQSFIRSQCSAAVWFSERRDRGRPIYAQLMVSLVAEEDGPHPHLGRFANETSFVYLDVTLPGTARQSSAEHPIATKAPRCTATAWMLTVAESFAKF